MFQACQRYISYPFFYKHHLFNTLRASCQAIFENDRKSQKKILNFAAVFRFRRNALIVSFLSLTLNVSIDFRKNLRINQF